ncbi:Ubiquitin carboxyl-terminal hydrolase isozyme L3 [Picochlorum sp. SENEW3]|nr:Ubiquitin carboxyl-terminal hydrolase isozyme L3 [Picochlorum sp. SENEW3]
MASVAESVPKEEQAGRRGKRWVPLEANPDVLNSFAQKLGAVNIGGTESHHSGGGYSFQDVYGLDEELLAMVPQPVLAVILLYPLTEASETARLEELARAKQDAAAARGSVFYMKQTIGNACGTIALLHCIGNNTDSVSFKDGSFLDEFVKSTDDFSPEARGEYLENPPEGGPSIDAIHADAAHQGQTEAPSVDDAINLHFVAFVEHEGGLWELDGRRAGPVYHGETTPQSLLHHVAAVVKAEYISKSDSNDFSLMALAATA